MCKSSEVYLAPSSERGQYTVRLGKQTMLLRIVLLDGEHLLAYMCTHLLSSGFCAAGAHSVGGFSRTQGQMSGTVLARGMQLCQRMCQHPGDFVTFTSTGV